MKSKSIGTERFSDKTRGNRPEMFQHIFKAQAEPVKYYKQKSQLSQKTVFI